MLFSKIVSLKLEPILLSVCGFRKNQKWNLLYRATEHGFSAKDFHSKCDDHCNTLSIIKTTDGYVFGGYASLDWKPSCEQGENGHLITSAIEKKDPAAFLFSFVNKRALKYSFANEKIYCHPKYGPAFGLYGRELCLADNSENKMKGSSYLSNTQCFPKEIQATSTFFAGSNEFKIDEVEVFSKINKI